jgi:L-fuculose-phosphate aldolase
MKMLEARLELIEYGKQLLDTGLTTGTGGNLSVCDRESNVMAITPSGIHYHEIKPEQIVLIDVESGTILEGDAVPSSERDMHRIFYKYRTDIDAIIHTHTPYAATLSCLRVELPALHYLVAFGGLTVRCADYATYGTVQLAKNAFEAMKDRKAALLANHGLICGGSSLQEALDITDQIEFCCRLYTQVKAIGEPVLLSEDEMVKMIDRFKDYGKAIEEHESI